MKNRKIVFYGAASIGKIIYDRVKNTDLDLFCYIDKRAEEIKYLNTLPVFYLDDLIFEKINKDEFVIFISVKNVFEHTDVANELIKRGFHNIIYRPLSAINGVGSEKQNRINEVYDVFESGKIEEIEWIPKSLKIDMYVPQNRSIIAEDACTITAWFPIDILHTDNKVKGHKWSDIPVPAFIPHIDLFRHIAGDSSCTCDVYLEYCTESAINNGISVTEAWKANVIKNRSSVYEHMSHAAELEADFFVRNAVNAIYDKEQGLFNLNSGKHRAAFFASMKRKYIPMKVAKEDYSAFINMEWCSRLEKYLVDNEVMQLKAPIPHPFFYDYPCETKEFYYNYMFWLLHYIGVKQYTMKNNVSLNGLRIFSLLDDYGFLERILIGAGVLLVHNINDEITDIINKLFFVKSSFFQKTNDDGFDYILVDLSVKDVGDKLIENNPIKRDGTEVIIILDGDKHKERAVIGEKCFASIMDGKEKICLKKEITSLTELKVLMEQLL
ncbi:MAG: hypothetical protein K6F86_09075 [Lachnospiraceae bacterium]|nr:hypothetical protein [Lachnospiraceae bacterium]